ncbi:synaptotagmin-12 [Caerostris extrusa]|uniref:Synaptotagmin-12 n=1 Tax=Caerostris extrusa TaxID=172846 RepID=A0AAV4NKS9_CAEEX|nr:synaptotagmin-12 [Caerostris extrusa]
MHADCVSATEISCSSRKTEELIVPIMRARNLMAFDSSAAKVDSYIRVSLLPDESSIMQTALHRGNNEPVYNERFVFRAPRNTLPERVLKCIAYTCDKSSNTMLGQIEMKLSSVDLRSVYNAWLPLIDSKRVPNIADASKFGSRWMWRAVVLFELSSHGRTPDSCFGESEEPGLDGGKDSADPFVKIYLLQKGKKISKKKTSVKKGDPNPVFNEAMIFSVPAAALQNIQLRLTLAEYQVEGKLQQWATSLWVPTAPENSCLTGTR